MNAIGLMLACGNGIELAVDGHAIRVEVADTDVSRARGLMHRADLKDGTGMLFVYEDSAVRHFWMKNTLIPLSIAFISEEGKIVRISDMAPQSEEQVGSVHPVPYALEVPLGWFERNGVERGDFVTGIPTAP